MSYLRLEFLPRAIYYDLPMPCLRAGPDSLRAPGPCPEPARGLICKKNVLEDINLNPNSHPRLTADVIGLQSRRVIVKVSR